MRKKYAIYSIISLALIALIGGLYIAYSNGYIRMNYPSLADYPVQGIDISHHQGIIDWNKLDTAVVKFVFMKATEGASHKDSLFQENWENAKSLNIRAGAYHYFTFCKSGEEQAQNFIQSVPKDSASLPPAIDLEFGGNCKKENHKEDIMLEIGQFIKTVENHYQKRVIIYSTYEFYNAYLINLFLNNPIWIRDILTTPKLKDNRNWLFWQYTNRGKLDGIDTYVDLNVFKGTKEDFEKLIESSTIQ